MSRRITIDVARAMPYKDLVETLYGLLEPYEKAVEGEETATELEDRLSRTYDEVPAIHVWFLTLHAYFDHWTDFYHGQFGAKDLTYKGYRQKRDLCDNAARAARLCYEGASRRMTQVQRHEEGAGMRQSRY